MHCAPTEDEKADENRCDTGTEARVVVSSAAPEGEAIAEEVVVAGAELTSEDCADEGETGEALGGETLGFADLSLGKFAAGRSGRLVFVGVEPDGLLFVGFVDVLLGGRGASFDADKICGVLVGRTMAG